jgi:pimeloyl-ACP methyl ester carboxylesterase
MLMSTVAFRGTGTDLAFEQHGDGVPVVFLHGLTFDRTTWRPIIDQLGAGVRSIAIDLPGHGATGGRASCSLDEVAARVRALVDGLGVERPVVVGHSMSGGIATVYAAAHPARGAVIVDSSPDMRPFVELVQRLESALRGLDFARVFQGFQQSMGIDRVPEPLRALVLASQDLRQDVVLGYWDQAFRTSAAELQAGVDRIIATVNVPFLYVFGHELPIDDRRQLETSMPSAQVEVWPDRGHFVHLAEPDRFAARLRSFIEKCSA